MKKMVEDFFDNLSEKVQDETKAIRKDLEKRADKVNDLIEDEKIIQGIFKDLKKVRKREDNYKEFGV